MFQGDALMSSHLIFVVTSKYRHRKNSTNFLWCKLWMQANYLLWWLLRISSGSSRTVGGPKFWVNDHTSPQPRQRILPWRNKWNIFYLQNHNLLEFTDRLTHQKQSNKPIDTGGFPQSRKTDTILFITPWIWYHHYCQAFKATAIIMPFDVANKSFSAKEPSKKIILMKKEREPSTM